jgi:hypothetical protein
MKSVLMPKYVLERKGKWQLVGCSDKECAYHPHFWVQSEGEEGDWCYDVLTEGEARKEFEQKSRDPDSVPLWERILEEYCGS